MRSFFIFSPSVSYAPSVIPIKDGLILYRCPDRKLDGDHFVSIDNNSTTLASDDTGAQLKFLRTLDRLSERSVLDAFLNEHLSVRTLAAAQTPPSTMMMEGELSVPMASHPLGK